MFTWEIRNPRRPEVDIEVQLHDERIYTSFDQIDGLVTITAAEDTDFTQLDVELLGISKFSIKSSAAFAATPRATDGYERILEIEQPDAMGFLPSDQVLKSSTRYKIPFSFTIPEFMLDTTCCRPGISTALHERHRRLPPSLRDFEAEKIKDKTSESASIRYRVVTRLWRAEHDQRALLAMKSARVGLLPSAPIQPPVPDAALDGFILCKEINTKRKLLGAAGKLIVSSAEPPPLQLQLCSDSKEIAGSTTAHILLQLDARDSSTPSPRLGMLHTKILIETHSTSFFHDTTKPLPQRWLSKTDKRMVPLSSRSIAGVVWAQYRLNGTNSSLQQDEAFKGDADPSKSWRKLTGRIGSDPQSFFGARIAVPVAFPCDASDLTPTFQTCSIERRYRLIMTVEICSAGIAKNVSLEVPLQISLEGQASLNTLHTSRMAWSNAGSDLEPKQSILADSAVQMEELEEPPQLGDGRGWPTEQPPPRYSRGEFWTRGDRKCLRPFR